MPNITAKTVSNPFYQARIQASAHNEQLSSREGAADLMLIDRGRLYRIENGVADPYPEEVHMMADLYGAPELRNFYCKHKCPLGCNHPEVMPANLDRITVRAMATIRKMDETKERLLDIAGDGDIDSSELPELKNVLSVLEEVTAITASLQNWIEKEGGKYEHINERSDQGDRKRRQKLLHGERCYGDHGRRKVKGLSHDPDAPG